ncbi:MAG: hypothetical protein C4547_11845 [Phycisphaerales bacterium]|nr:MAG: hypothetical protein C4547_11845 [Phycisphaerales bacterium]
MAATRTAAGHVPVKATAELQLDALLKLRDNRMRAQAAAKPPPSDPAEIFRRKVESQFVPILDELASKYVAKGIVIEWDLSSMLTGGREMIIEFALRPVRWRLRGTLARDVVAFEVTRFVGESGGEVCSGPMLSIRTLDQGRFREFVCEQLAMMIRYVLRTTRR